MTRIYTDDQAREQAKWAHDRREREAAEHEAAGKADWSKYYEGYYEEE